ncbi:neuronal acetylcholine receptor subunit alpha-7-like [Haliotis asinina]|uniref:neuronal acetylcholine receptor subunit alpha-7-like n=1 Tax=Haliotis asinina TaxID=109174 RepID=UPI0035321B83
MPPELAAPPIRQNGRRNRQSIFSASIDDIHRLRHHLFNNYSSDVRPLLNQSQPLVIDVSFQFMRIHYIDNAQKEFSIRGILSLAWKDEFLFWDAGDFGGLKHYHPKKGEIWKPSILNEDGVEDQEVARKPLFAILNIVIPIVTIAILSMMVFLVPVESGEKLSFSLSALLSLAVFMSFISEQIPASSEKPPLLVIYLTSMVARKPLFAILNIVIPIVTIAILSMMVFLVPVESGEKLSFSLSALLSLAVFMSFISEQIPASSEKPPLLVIYLTSMVARKPLFAILNIVIPIVTIAILSMMVFLVPVESGEKLSFSLSALLSLAVFMSFISEQIPASSEKPPLLVIYLTSMISLLTVQPIHGEQNLSTSEDQKRGKMAITNAPTMVNC